VPASGGAAPEEDAQAPQHRRATGAVIIAAYPRTVATARIHEHPDAYSNILLNGSSSHPPPFMNG